MKKIFLLAIASLTLAACDKNEDNPVISPVAAHISATIGESVLTRTSDNSWSEGDKIGISSLIGSTVGPFINMEYTSVGGSGIFDGDIIYIYNPMSLTAYYPFDGIQGKTPGVDGIISADTKYEKQISGNQSGIDFLYAKVDDITVDDPDVKFEFAHKMSKLTFLFKSGSGMDISKIVSYKIDGLVLNGTFNTSTGECIADNTDPGSLDINLSDVEVKEGVALNPLIIFPQTTYSKTVTLTITDSDDQVYTCELKFDNNSIVAGNNYLYNITVNKTGLNINEWSIGNWNTEESSAGAGSVIE